MNNSGRCKLMVDLCLAKEKKTTEVSDNCSNISENYLSPPPSEINKLNKDSPLNVKSHSSNSNICFQNDENAKEEDGRSVIDQVVADVYLMNRNNQKIRSSDTACCNTQKNNLSPAKIQIIEDWLLGVKPKCIYSKLSSQNDQSMMIRKHNGDVRSTDDQTKGLPDERESCVNSADIENDDDSVEDPDYIPDDYPAKKKSF
ncbi:uncharacterized protein LOC132701344 [Cylas formicarius]|uniref:uncharacterized protein LOC132701344 n=1 Tax=Cylas formicarius TaxID=197179 RepID=UPI0029589627|nr:uncharacterized protein LOC132701344 [Cylas formicarius]